MLYCLCNNDIVIINVGDYQANSDTSLVLQGIASSSASFNLALGDLSYGALRPETAWCEYVKFYIGAEFPFELLSGNHEDNELKDNINRFLECLPDRIGNLTGSYAKEYYFDYQGLARIIMISPELRLDGIDYKYTKGNTRYNWVASAIDSARAANISWVVVGMHKVCLTAGIKTCEIGPDLMNLLIAKKLTWFCKHTSITTKEVSRLLIIPLVPMLL